jgi:anthranilate synthase component 1
MKTDLKILPSLDEFKGMTRKYNVIPVWTEILADLTTPVALFNRCIGSKDGFLLESVDRGEHWGRWSFIGGQPLATITCEKDEIHLEGSLPVAVNSEIGLLELLTNLLDVFETPTLDDFPPLHSGLVGYLGYDIVREVENLPHIPPDDKHLPDAKLSVIGDLIAIDHWKQRAFLISNVLITDEESERDLEEKYQSAISRLHNLAEAGATGLEEPLMFPPPSDEELPEVVSTFGADQFCLAVEAAKEQIINGEIFQVVLSQRFDVELDADPFDVYRVLRQINPSPYMYFFRYEELTIVGASPEPMVRLVEGKVFSRPIAGTRKRGKTDEEDRILASELKEDPKEVAEHVMLLDLARNDVGRVVEFGTETVDETMTLEKYSHVMHLTSQVSGNLRNDLGPIDVLRATLPAGTVSGAPKVRAMQIIDELEPTKRGPYAGVVGYFDFSGNIDTAITIRTMIVKDGLASVQAGAGIVADSDPHAEDLECRNKARALLGAIPAARRMSRQRQSER